MGNQGFFSRMNTYDPINQLTGGKINPWGHYSASSGPSTPGAWAGTQSSLAGANAGYGGVPTGGGAAGGTVGAVNPYVAASQSATKQYGQPQTMPRPGTI